MIAKQFDWIRTTYRVPARRGGRVTFNEPGDRNGLRGTIIGVTGPHLKVRFDGEQFPVPVHPKALDYEVVSE